MKNKTQLQKAHDDYMSLSVLGRERMRSTYECIQSIGNDMLDRDKVKTDNLDEAVKSDKADQAVILIESGIMPSTALMLVEWSKG